MWQVTVVAVVARHSRKAEQTRKIKIERSDDVVMQSPRQAPDTGTV